MLLNINVYGAKLVKYFATVLTRIVLSGVIILLQLFLSIFLLKLSHFPIIRTSINFIVKKPRVDSHLTLFFLPR